MAQSNKGKIKVKVRKAPAGKAKARKPAAREAKVAKVAKAKPAKAKVAKAKPAKAKVAKAKAQKPKARAFKSAVGKPAVKKSVKQRPVAKSNGNHTAGKNSPVIAPNPAAPVKLNPFLKKQRDHLLQLRDGMLDSMMGVAKDNLRSRAEGSEASAFGMHQADAGSDAYDRDFALSLLSQEQDALYEIDAALKRIDLGTYGICEMSGKPIPHARLEAIPFTRYTVECQSQLEKQNKLSRTRVPVTSLFGLTDEEGGETEEEESIVETKE